MLDCALLPPAGSVLVIAVSGGCDSMALWAMLARSGHWPLVIWHLDHGIRADSALDAELIQSCALPGERRCERADIPALARNWHVSLELAGRRHRYARLSAVAADIGAAWVVTGHHADDQAETVMMHLLRGSHGLVGMPATRMLGQGVSIVRPLLRATRADLRAWATGERIAWREDLSNRDLAFHRNRIRHEVLPTFERGCPGFTAALLAAVHLEQSPPSAEPAVRIWLRHRRLSVSRAIIRRLLDLAPGTGLTLGGRRIVRTASGWDDVPESPASIPDVTITGGGVYHRDDSELTIAVGSTPDAEAFAHGAVPGVGWISADAIRGQVSWRSVRAGERWQHLGSTGHQAVVATAGALGVPPALRAGLSVLADEEGPLWLACGAIAERARVTGKRAWRITLAGPGAPTLEKNPLSPEKS